MRSRARTISLQGERTHEGSASILIVGACAVLVAVAAMAIGASGAYIANRRVSAAADAAALAGADTVSGYVAGYPCESAAEAARLVRAELGECTVSGLTVEVEVRFYYLGMAAVARARAGPSDLAHDGAKLSDDPQD